MESSPRASYRIQLNGQFTFELASEQISYLSDLGISHLYFSPITKSREGSLHGYDVVDYHVINPEIGTEEEFFLLNAQLKKRGMGLLIDFVPNHMCIADPRNIWWQDVMENGRKSIYSDYFQIYWDLPKQQLQQKIQLPILDDTLEHAVDHQAFSLDCENGVFYFLYKTVRYPIDPQTWPLLLEAVAKEHPTLLDKILKKIPHLTTLPFKTPAQKNHRHAYKEALKDEMGQLLDKNPILLMEIKRTFGRFLDLLKSQPYLLIYWKTANACINYHRFFYIDDLAGLHLENKKVFQAIHKVLFQWLKKGGINALRIDHIDGLIDPEGYLQHLAKKMDSFGFPLTWVLVEKILTGDEALPAEWPISGTTGYDFLNLVNGVFVDQEQLNSLQNIYEQFIGRRNRLQEIAAPCKKLILHNAMANELMLLVYRLAEISHYPIEKLQDVLKEFIGCFPVYRTYIKPDTQTVSERDRNIIETTVGKVKANRGLDEELIDYIADLLLLSDRLKFSKEQLKHRDLFISHFQQLTCSIMAKGFEDTALYRAYPLASLNEVGMDSQYFGVGAETFHLANQARLLGWPKTQLATFTHDTKRSEDVRARLHVLSEKPHEWQQALQQWAEQNKKYKKIVGTTIIPDANEEYLLYQTLVGTWPGLFHYESKSSHYLQRIVDYMLKALKEAKVHTSWLNSNEPYEKGVEQFIHSVMDLNQNLPFLMNLDLYVESIKEAGYYNSLSQLVLKCTVPGIPDFYQGSELWELTLVDPDNRHPIDYHLRQIHLDEIMTQTSKNLKRLLQELTANLDDGRLKLYVMWRLLQMRKDFPALFEKGEYLPVEVRGEKSRHLIAFMRKGKNNKILVLASRFHSLLMHPGQKDWKSGWGNTTLVLEGGHWQDLFTEETLTLSERPQAISEFLRQFPFTVLKKI